MTEAMKVSLSNPLGVFLGSFAMFLGGVVIGELWHASKTAVLAVTLVAAVLAVAHELLCGFLWCSFTAWWIGRRSATCDSRR